MWQNKKNDLAYVVFALFAFGSWNAFGQETNLAHGLESSLGQLCKRAHVVVSGQLDGVGTNQEGEIIVRMSSCSNILGAPVSGLSSYILGQFADDRELSPGRQAVVFLSSTAFDAFNADAYRFDYQAPKAEGTSCFVVGGTRGIIQEDAASIGEVIEALAGYWSLLHSPSRDPIAYASFLSSLKTSSVERVRTDAQRDLRLLIRFADIQTLRQIAKDLTSSGESRTYLDSILRWKEQGMPITVRDWEPTKADWDVWMSALSSTSAVDRLRALAEMSRPERRESVYSESTRWHDKVVPLLQDSDEGVRLSSALLLSNMSDNRAWEVLVDMLRSTEVYRRRDAWKELVRASDGACPPFDPDAAPAQRDQSFAQLKVWVKTQIVPVFPGAVP